MSQQNHRLRELNRSIRLDVPVFPRREIVVSRTISNRGFHVEPLAVGEPVSDQLANAIVAAPVASHVDNNGLRVLELFDDLVNRRSSLFHPPKVAKMKIADRVGKPAVVKHVIDK